MLGDALTQAVLADWRTAPIDDQMRATLGFLEKLTLSPDEIQPEDIRAMRAAGLGDQAIVDVIYICALFSLIDRVADALGFAIPPSFAQGAAGQLKRGYKMS